MWFLPLALLLLSGVGASYMPNSPQCGLNEYWCQDRCGSDLYGDTCCTTPDGEHNMCGASTTCCLHGCCPNNSTCNDIGACVRAVTTTNSAGQTITSITTVVPPATITDVPMSFTYTTTSTFIATSVTEISTHLPSATTLTSVVGSGGDETVTVIGTDYITLPHVTTTFVFTTIGHTITVVPPETSATPQGPLTTVFPDGQTLISSSDIIVIASSTVTLPAVSDVTLLTTFGETFTLSPHNKSLDSSTTIAPIPTASTTTDSPSTSTLLDGVVVVSSSGSVVIGTDAIAVPTTPTTVNMGGATLTFNPPDTVSLTAVSSSTLLGEGSIISSSGILIIGSETITIPTSITTALTITTDGVILTLGPTSTAKEIGGIKTATETESKTTDVETPSTTTTSPLTTYSSWPPLKLVPVMTSVAEPQTTDGDTIIPCNLWFFFICINWGGPPVFGWKFSLPPGIYPPGPPGIEFPSWIKVSGTLPPWPQITIGNDYLPTYSSEPTSCQTETATMCAITTSYGVSSTFTTTSQAFSTCSPIVGCNVEDQTTTATTAGTCPTSTVTDAWVSCATNTGTASCTVTSTSLVSGCSITATTMKCTSTSTRSALSTATGFAIRQVDTTDLCIINASNTYIIYPKDSSDADGTAAITDLISSLVDPDSIRISEADGHGIVYWSVALTSDQASDVMANANVNSLFIPCVDSCYDPTTTLVMQPNAPWHLVFLDQFGDSPGSTGNIPLSWFRNNYVYEQSGGAQVDVYIVDSGADMTRSDFLTGPNPANQRTRFVHTSSTMDKGDIDLGSHGTSMLSVITGATVGVVRNINPIVVQNKQTGHEALWLDGLTAVLNDARSRGIKRGVVSLSVYWPKKDTADYEGTSQQFAWLLKLIIAEGLLVVTGSGNAGDNTMDGIPAIFGATDPSSLSSINNIPELIVVGAVDSTGQRSLGSNMDTKLGLPNVYAPGVKILNAFAGGDEMTETSGTSHAAAITSGLAAYLLGLTLLDPKDPDYLQRDLSTPALLKEYILELAWERVAGFPALYNGLLPSFAGDLNDGPSCPIVQRRSIPESELPEMASCSPDPTPSSSLITSSSVIVWPTFPIITAAISQATTLITSAGTSSVLVAPTPPMIILTTPSQLTTLITSTGTSETTTDTPVSTTQLTATAQPIETVTVTPLTLGVQQCNDESDFPGHGDVSYRWVMTHADLTCKNVPMSSESLPKSFNRTESGVPYYTSVAWLKGCTTTVTEQNILQPLGDSEEITCRNLIAGDWSNCNNGGVGGSIVAGCVEYLFSYGQS